MNFGGCRHIHGVEFEIYLGKTKYKSVQGEKEDGTGAVTLFHLKYAVAQVETDLGIRL